MNKWIAEKDLMKHHYLKKKTFTVILIWKILQILIKITQKKVWEDFRKKHLGDYHDLYVQIDASLLVDVFENFRNECIKKYDLDLAYFLSAPRLAWEACFKKK